MLIGLFSQKTRQIGIAKRYDLKYETRNLDNTLKNFLNGWLYFGYAYVFHK